MKYVIVDLTSKYYLAVDATPKAPFLLREQSINATQFDNRAEAVRALEAANTALVGKYREMDLSIKPSSEKSHRQTQRVSAFYDTRRSPRTAGNGHHGADVSDRLNDVFEHNRKYDRDMS